MDAVPKRGCRAALFALAVLVLPVHVVPALAQTAPDALPPLQTQGEVQYLSGGIGSEEVAAIKAVRDRFALSVTLAARVDGHDVYLASVPLTIKDDSGRTVLDVVTDGPFLLARLPPGRYEVAAQYAGEVRQSLVHLAAGRPQRVTWSWPQLASDGAASAAPPAAAVSAAPPPPAPPPPEAAPAPADTPAALVAADDPDIARRDPALPPRQAQGGVPYLSGGIGSEEAAAIQAASSQYSLAVTLSASEGGHGVFLASVPLTISDHSGVTVLDVVSDGPYLLVDLPPGPYMLRAQYAGQEKTAKLTIRPGRTARVSFSWVAAP